MSHQSPNVSGKKSFAMKKDQESNQRKENKSI